MTFIQPHKDRTIFTPILFLFGGIIFVAAFWLIILYNQIVNIQHSISETNSNFQTLQTKNAELKDDLFSLFSDKNSERLELEKRLVQDKKPQYLEVNSKWALASQQ